MLEPAPKGSWINPLLPLFGLMILGGLFTTALNTNKNQMNATKANILEEVKPIASECTAGAEEIRSCEVFGKQIWVCSAEGEWEGWGECIIKR